MLGQIGRDTKIELVYFNSGAGQNPYFEVRSKILTTGHLGAGFKYKFSEKFKLNVGASYRIIDRSKIDELQNDFFIEFGETRRPSVKYLLPIFGLSFKI